MSANIQPPGYQQKEYCPECDGGKPWHGWIEIGPGISREFRSRYCKDCLIKKNKNDFSIILGYLQHWSNQGFSTWVSIARVVMARDLYYDPRGDYLKLSDITYNKLEYELDNKKPKGEFKSVGVEK